jgi:threonine dehydratase
MKIMRPETIKLITDLAPVLATTVTLVIAIAAGLWAVLVYLRQQRGQNHTRLIESKKPFLELQLKLYFEAVQVAGQLVVSPVGTSEWNKAIYRFWALYWSELAMVEDHEVEKAMMKFADAIRECIKPESNNSKAAIEAAAYALAHKIRDGVESAWGANANFKKLQNSVYRLY